MNNKKAYLNDNEEVNEVMNDILKILRDINDIVGTENFHHMGIEKLVKDCIHKWHEKGYNNLDLAAFHIMIVMQISRLASRDTRTCITWCTQCHLLVQQSS